MVVITRSKSAKIRRELEEKREEMFDKILEVSNREWDEVYYKLLYGKEEEKNGLIPGTIYISYNFILKKYCGLLVYESRGVKTLNTGVMVLPDGESLVILVPSWLGDEFGFSYNCFDHKRRVVFYV